MPSKQTLRDLPEDGNRKIEAVVGALVGVSVGVVLDNDRDHLPFFVKLKVAKRRTPLHQPPVEIEVATVGSTTTEVLPVAKVLKAHDHDHERREVKRSLYKD